MAATSSVMRPLIRPRSLLPRCSHRLLHCLSVAFPLRRPSRSSLSHSPSSSPLLPLPPPRRYIQTHVDELRTGMIIDHDGRMHRVQSHSTHMRGRAHTTISLELKDVTSNKSTSLRLRPSDKVEQVQLDAEELTFLYRDAATLYFMHPTTFEPIEMPADTVDEQLRPFLTDNSSLRCTRRGAQWLGVDIPPKVQGRVVKTEGRHGGAKGLNNDTEGRRGLLENGVWIEGLPNSVDVGDEVVVNTTSLTFASKVE